MRGGRTALVGLVLGSPRDASQVLPFLEELFTDPYMLKLPFQPWLGRLIARRRAPRAREKYAAIGGRSPLMEVSLRQVQGAAGVLRERGLDVVPFLAARYLGPRAVDVAAEIKDQGFDQVVALPLYPHQSRVTTGSSLSDLKAAVHRVGLDVPLVEVGSYCEHPGYIAALARAVEEGISGLGKDQEAVHLLFVAHSIPTSLVEQGDPYPGQVQATVKALCKALGWKGSHSLAYQSRVGPVSWLGPPAGEEVERLAAEGRRAILAVPVSFVSDHLETLYDIDMELSDIAGRSGVERFVRAPALNDGPGFIAALADIVQEVLS